MSTRSPKSDRGSSKSGAPFGKIIGGRLDISGRGITDFQKLGVQPTLEVLVVSNNQIRSFETLQPQPNLKTIIAANNPIEVLNGLPEQPKLEKLDLTGTPLSKRDGFRVITLATVGENLIVLNGEKLNKQDQSIASILAKRTPEKLFLGKPEVEEEEEEEETLESRITIHEVYVKEHQQFFSSFAYNEAVLWDLQEHGPMPYIDEISTEEEIARAITSIRNRVEGIRLKITELGGIA